MTYIQKSSTRTKSKVFLDVYSDYSLPVHVSATNRLIPPVLTSPPFPLEAGSHFTLPNPPISSDFLTIA